MKNPILYLIVLVICYSCIQNNEQNTTNKSKNNNSKLKTSDSLNLSKKDSFNIFSFAKTFPEISDSARFISELRKAFDLDIAKFSEQQANEKINTYKKIKLYGSQKELMLVEYDYLEGASAGFPWKYQIIMTTEGKLISVLSGVRYEFLEIFKNQPPLLLVLFSTSKGNGIHKLFKLSNDTLENVLDKDGYFPRTYDAHSDYHINKPNELKLKIHDKNKDGFNDLIFSGKMLLNSFGNNVDDDLANNKSIQLELIFMYDKQSGHFKEFEDYSKKYKEH